MSLNLYVKQSVRITESDAFGASDRSTEFTIHTHRINAASAHQKTYRSISAGLSNQEINLSPITVSNPGKSIILISDQPLDIRINASNNSMISEVRQLMIAASGTISSLFIGVPNSTTAANIYINVVAGGTLTTSTPLP